MILTLPPIQLPATGEFERNLSFSSRSCITDTVALGMLYVLYYILVHVQHICMYVAVGPLYIATFYKDRLFIAMYIP